MQFLENKIPPPLVTMLFGLAMWLCVDFVPLVNISDTARLVGALVLIASGFFFSGAGVLSFRRARTTVNPLKPDTATSLVSSGIFAYSRNPMYVGMALVLCGWACYLGSPWLLLGVAGFVLYINFFQIVPEERAMLTLFGDEFVAYQARVRRWV